MDAPATLDSRHVEPGGLFVALAGEHVDGHDYAARAVEAGAAAVLASRDTGVPSVVVPDVTAALGQLARHVLDEREDVQVVALTGSSGKTSVKDLLAHLLAPEGATVATHGNHNNELGVPLTVLEVDELTRYLVVEMGARAVGDISHLCAIAPPDLGIVLNVGSAHVGEFGSADRIAQAKGELAEARRRGRRRGAQRRRSAGRGDGRAHQRPRRDLRRRRGPGPGRRPGRRARFAALHAVARTAAASRPTYR